MEQVGSMAKAKGSNAGHPAANAPDMTPELVDAVHKAFWEKPRNKERPLYAVLPVGTRVVSTGSEFYGHNVECGVLGTVTGNELTDACWHGTNFVGVVWDNDTIGAPSNQTHVGVVPLDAFKAKR